MNEVYLILGMFLATFSVRFVLFAVAGKVHFPVWLNQALGFVPPTVLTAIILPAVLMPEGEIWFSWQNPWLLAGIFAALVALIRKDLMTTIVAGMAFFLVLRFGFGF